MTAMPPPVAAGAGNYTPQASPLTASGMRPISELFNDAGRIIRRAWFPIGVISVVVWLAWFVVAVFVALLMVDQGQLRRAMATLGESWSTYPQGNIPRSVSTEIGQQFADSLRSDSAVVWTLIAVALIALAIYASCFQLTAVNRLAMDAAAGQPVAMSNGIRSGFVGGLRLFGYAIMLTAVVVGIFAALALLITVTASVPAIAGTIGVVGYLVFLVAAFIVGIRLLPLTAQVVVDRGALGWSWNASRGKFLAILGRYILWGIVASIVANIVLSIVFFPVGLLLSAALASADPGASLIWIGIAYLLLLPLSMAVSALTMIGVVPIWRDLTNNPKYRAISAEGVPLKTTI